MQPLLQQVSAAHAVGALPSLAWLAILILIYAIELVVGAIQAYVFTVLTAVYVSRQRRSRRRSSLPFAP